MAELQPHQPDSLFERIMDQEPDFFRDIAGPTLRRVLRTMVPLRDKIAAGITVWLDESRRRAETDPLLHPGPPDFSPPRRRASRLTSTIR